MNLTLRDIEYFVAVVEHRGLARAAAALGLTQPTLSKSLRRLEEETGLPLLERGTRPVQPTSAGLVFLEHARRLRAEYADAVRNTSELRAGRSGLLRVGAAGATLDTVVLPTLAGIFPNRPALRVQILAGLSDELIAGVEEGRLDVAVIPSYVNTPGHLNQVTVGRDDLHMIAPRKHPLALKPRVSLADLGGQRWVLPKASSYARVLLDSCFAEAGLPLPDAAMEVDSISVGVLELIQATGMIAAAPETVLQRAAHLQLVRLPMDMGGRLRRSVSLVSRHAGLWSPLMAEFRDALVQRLHR